MNTTWPTVAERGRILLLPPGRAHWERPLRTFCAHCAPDPTPSPSQEGSNTGWPVPLLGGVRGGWLAGRFMGSPLSFFRMHWDQEPIRFGPRAVPARSGRAKTRAWVIFQGCWRGPHAATGDRSRSATSLRPTHGHGWFMESPDAFSARIGTMNLDWFVAADVSRLKLPQ